MEEEQTYFKRREQDLKLDLNSQAWLLGYLD